MQRGDTQCNVHPYTGSSIPQREPILVQLQRKASETNQDTKSLFSSPLPSSLPLYLLCLGSFLLSNANVLGHWSLQTW